MDAIMQEKRKKAVTVTDADIRFLDQISYSHLMHRRASSSAHQTPYEILQHNDILPPV